MSHKRLRRAACRLVGHDWFSLVYPPGPRRQRCSRCGDITEDPCTITAI